MNMQTSTPTNQIVRPAIVAVVLFTIITGILYPALVTGIAQAIFPAKANGSLIRNSAGVVIGSELIGQEFSDPIYFWGRPSATAPVPYNAAASSGSNLGPLNPALIGEDGLIQTRITALRTADADADVENNSPLPVDLVTASASGLDPHISPAAAAVQSARIAALRGIDVAAVESLISELTEERMFSLLGEPRVNVLRLNLALDQHYPPPATPQP